MKLIRSTKFSLISAALILVLNGCKKDKGTIDTEYPVINITTENAFPKQCSNVSRGQKFSFIAEFSDNVELGAYGLDIHHNFDRHSHSTELTVCEADAVKKPVNPLLLIKSYDITPGQRSYSANLELDVPANVDPGDYHFLIRLTDKAGWQTLKGISIKIQ